MPEREPFVAGLVLAAGGSTRLGQPKQLLPFGSATLLDHTLSTARQCRFEQLLVAIGGSAELQLPLVVVSAVLAFLLYVGLALLPLVSPRALR